METRTILAAVLIVICSPAMADEQITIRDLGDRLLIEDANGRDVGTIRETYGDNLIIEDMNGRDLGTIRDTGRLDDCDDQREPLSCLFEEDK